MTLVVLFAWRAKVVRVRLTNVTVAMAGFLFRFAPAFCRGMCLFVTSDTWPQSRRCSAGSRFAKSTLTLR
jgi:hypothetical protein